VLQTRYEQTWLLEDVEERIRVLRDGLATPSESEHTFSTGSFPTAAGAANEDYSEMITCLYQLSVALGDRYKHTGQFQDLGKQVNLLQRALSARLLANSDIAIFIQCELGAALRTRFSHLADSADIVEA